MTTIAVGAQARVWKLSFYTWMGAACVLTAFLGFIPTYWTPLAAGQFQANPVVHMHGAGFFTWTIFATVQASLIPNRQVALHRALGMIGISLATVLTMLGLLAALNALKAGITAGQAAGAEAFLIVPLQVIASFAVLFIVAVSNIRRPEVHKRLMLLATISVLNAPLARPLIAYVYHFPPPPAQLPVWINVPAYAASFVLLIPPLVYDWRKNGRIHPVYLIGIPALAFLAWVVIPLSETQAWHAFARDYAALAGKPGG